MTINELRTKRAKAWESAKAFLDSHRNDKGVLSAEDDATYSRMENDISELGKEIARMERLEAMDIEMSKPVNTPIIEKPEAPKSETKAGRAADDYKKAFWNHARKRDSYEVRNALQIGTDSEGGYLVPDTFEKTLISALEAENVIRKHAHVFTTSHGSHKIPVVSNRGTAAWVDEEGQIPESDDVFGQQLIGAHKVSTLIKVSEELLNDSAFDLEGYFTKEFARRIGNAEEAAFLSGNGTGKPTGILAGVGGAEIDIFEAPYYGKKTMHDSVTQTIHCAGVDGATEGYQSRMLGAFYGNDIYNEYNTYGVKWTEDEYIFYINGVETARTTFGNGTSQVEEEVRVSLEVPDASALEPLDKETYHSEFIVDYVRIYQIAE